MPTITFGNNKNYESGPAKVKSVDANGQLGTLVFSMANGAVVRETYRLYKPEEEERFQNHIAAILGNRVDQVDTEELIDRPCIVELGERPWKEGRTWFGVANVLPPAAVQGGVRKPPVLGRAIQKPRGPSSVQQCFEDEAAEALSVPA